MESTNGGLHFLWLDAFEASDLSPFARSWAMACRQWIDDTTSDLGELFSTMVKLNGVAPTGETAAGAQTPRGNICIAQGSMACNPLTCHVGDESFRVAHKVWRGRVAKQHASARDLAESLGGTNDIRRFTGPGPVDPHLRAMGADGRLSLIERDALLESWHGINRVRCLIDLLGFEPGVLPENPSRLEVLAVCIGLKDANRVLAWVEGLKRQASSIIEEAFGRTSE